MLFIDSNADHCDRGTIDIKHVYQKVDEARRKDDGTLVEHPHFEQLTWDEQYDYCICGKEIVYNYVAQCVETGKCFIVGSDCIERVCLNKHFDLKNKCCMCKDNYTPTLTSEYCKQCKALRQSGKSRVGFGEYKDKKFTYLKLYSTNPEYCEKIYNGTVKTNSVQQFKDWYIKIKNIEKYGYRISNKTPERIYLHVDYSERKDAKEYGVQWDSEKLKWYIFDNSPHLEIVLKKYSTIPNRINLSVPYANKEDAKQYGAQWDNEKRTWYIFDNSPHLEILLQKYKQV